MADREKDEKMTNEQAGCVHLEVSLGPRIPLRHGSAETEVCDYCKAWRTIHHTKGIWQYTPIENQLEEDEEF